MITKGYVIKKSTDSSNKYSVRIPILESAGIGLNSNGLNSSVYDCTLSHNPGTYEALRPGDCVFISFEDNNYAKPIILGKLFVNVEEESSGYQYNTDLKVTHKATLPVDTTIGSVPFDNILNYFNSINESIDRLSTQSPPSLSANLILYPTNASSDVSGYFKMVTNIDDLSYNTTAVDIPTGIINTNNQLLASLVSEPGVIIGNPGVINITTIGNIKRTVGNNNQYAAFYFTISKRSISGTETLLTTSNETPDVIIPNIYEEFSATALLNNGEFLNTDRIVIKYYANLTGNTGSNYDFQFGGTNPVRTLFPVPVSSIPSPKASNIITDTTTFNGILSSADNTVQKALNTLDDHNHNSLYYTETESDSRFLQLSGGTVGPVDITGNLRLTGTPTLTNQSRTIEFTGFDKEGEGDFSDNAYIRHTVNSGGLAGSVLEISSQNDADDGINFLTNGANTFRHNGNVIITGANIGSQSVSNAATATSADNIDGVAFRNTGSNSGINADTLNSNGVTYYNEGVPNFTGLATDGGLYSQVYNNDWQHQIAGDYRSGQIALRGKNNGTWQSWRTVLDSSNYSSYALPLSGGTIAATAIGPILTVSKTGSAPGNATPLLVYNQFGNHSWGIAGEFRNGNASGTDRPSIIFSSEHNTDTWSVGFGFTDSNFRIKQDHGWRNQSWGTTRLFINRDGNIGIGTETPAARLHVQGDITGQNTSGFSSIYRQGGIYFTWDAPNYGTNPEHSIRSTYGNDYGDHITLNSFGNIRMNIDSNNNGSNNFEIGAHTTGTDNILFQVTDTGNTNINSNLTVTGGTNLINKNNPAMSNTSYLAGNNHIELRTTDASNPSIGFHRSGFTAVALYHDANNSLRLRDANTGSDSLMWHSSNQGASGRRYLSTGTQTFGNGTTGLYVSSSFNTVLLPPNKVYKISFVGTNSKGMGGGTSCSVGMSCAITGGTGTLVRGKLYIKDTANANADERTAPLNAVGSAGTTGNFIETTSNFSTHTNQPMGLEAILYTGTSGNVTVTMAFRNTSGTGSGFNIVVGAYSALIVDELI